MKNILTFISVLFSLQVFACSWGPDDDAYFYYNIFDQENISYKEFSPFLRNDYDRFYNNANEFDNGNIALWKQLLPNWTEEEIKESLKEDFMWKPNKKYSTNVQKYFEFASSCNNAFAYRKDYSWNYHPSNNTSQTSTDELLKEANKLFTSEKNKLLKQRYAYQIVRILHYSQSSDGAIAFFNKLNSYKFDKNELYYYTLDQVAGALFNNQDYEKAAYYYMQVFQNSIDRKRSAYISYSWCVDRNFNGSSYLQSKTDSIGFLSIKSINEFSDPLTEFERILALDANCKELELHFVRALNNLERELFPRYIGFQNSTYPGINGNITADVLDLIAKVKLVQEHTNNTEFWKLSESYLYFLIEDVTKAQAILKEQKWQVYAKQAEILNKVYTVFAVKSNPQQLEKYVYPILDSVYAKRRIDYYDISTPPWKQLIVEYLAHLYYKEGSLAQAYLLHNNLSSLSMISNTDLLISLEAFFAKPKHNAFENMLIESTKYSNYSGLDIIKYQLGCHYIELSEFELAAQYLKDSPIDGINDYSLGNSISRYIFANNIKECFNCEADEVMDTPDYELYYDLQGSFTKYELVNTIQSLQVMAEKGSGVNAKIANYLLGNYYYNISNTGYFRGTLNGQTYLKDYNYFGYSRHEFCADDYINSGNGYNLSLITNFNKLYHEYAETAYYYYTKALQTPFGPNDDDVELNAAILYHMAKCELNRYYNHEEIGYWGYDGSVNDISGSYKESFETLKNEYSNTEFYNQIIQQCSFFKLYVNQ